MRRSSKTGFFTHCCHSSPTPLWPLRASPPIGAALLCLPSPPPCCSCSLPGSITPGTPSPIRCSPIDEIIITRSRGNRTSRMLGQESLQPLLHFRPFFFQDGEPRRIARDEVRRHAVGPQDAIQFSADAGQCITRALVPSIGIEVDAQNLPLLERVGQHQEFALGVRHCPNG